MASTSSRLPVGATVRMFDLATGTEVARQELPGTARFALAYSPDGRWLAAWSSVRGALGYRSESAWVWPAAGGPSVLGISVPNVVTIDHVLVGPAYAAVSTHTLDLPESDHRALVAEVALK